MFEKLRARLIYGLSTGCLALAAVLSLCAPQVAWAGSEASLLSSDFDDIQDSAAYDTSEGVFDRDSAYAILDMVNELRASVGVGALVWDSDLEATALVRAREVAESFSHTRPDGQSQYTAFPDDFGPGENIAWGGAAYYNASRIFNIWLNSEAHYNNMTYRGYRRMAVGCYVVNGRAYYAQCFGSDMGDGVRFTGVDDGSSNAAMLRLYNPNSGEHFYTSSAYERDKVAFAGWDYEGVGWTAPLSSASPVYRLYNENGGEHHYTLSAEERDGLIEAGWNYEGIGWYSDDAQSVSVYREYNPNAYSCNHNYTSNKAEHDYLVSIGWNDEGIAWYAVA